MKKIALSGAWTILFFVMSLYAAQQQASGDSNQYLVTQWTYEPNNYINQVYAVDLNGDGVDEIIASSRDGTVYSLGQDAKDHINWQTPVGGGGT